MSDNGHVWAVLLAAGDGKRVRALTTAGSGECVPKQFWAPDGENSLLHLAVRRASLLLPPSRIVAVVAEDHRAWWEQEGGGLTRDQIIVQPENRGTAVGILLPLLEVVRQDPRAIVLVLPTDHFVDDERVLRKALIRAVSAARTRPENLVLVGMEATGDLEGYGWILPAGPTGARGLRSVASFVEKPSSSVARELASRGALINSFIFVSSAETLLDLYASALPSLLQGFLGWSMEGAQQARLRELYTPLAISDFSRDVLERAPDRLSVLRVRGCGWLDLGVADRLLPFLRRKSPDPSAVDSTTR